MYSRYEDHVVAARRRRVSRSPGGRPSPLRPSSAPYTSMLYLTRFADGLGRADWERAGGAADRPSKMRERGKEGGRREAAMRAVTAASAASAASSVALYGVARYVTLTD